jgi:hypothetical protein
MEGEADDLWVGRRAAAPQQKRGHQPPPTNGASWGCEASETIAARRRTAQPPTAICRSGHSTRYACPLAHAPRLPACSLATPARARAGAAAPLLAA